jgi:hypothetical protein
MLARFLSIAGAFLQKLGAATSDGVALPHHHHASRAPSDDDFARAPAERKLGLYHLRQAAEVFEAVIAPLASIPSRLRAKVSEEVLPQDPADLEPLLDEGSRRVLRLEVDLLVAFDLATEADVGEFCAWAKRAVMSSRRAAGIVVPDLRFLFGAGFDIADPDSGDLDLVKLLHEAQRHVRSVFGPVPVVLRFISDPDAGDAAPELYLYIQTSLPVAEAQARLERLDEEWWLDALPRGKGRVCIALEYV